MSDASRGFSLDGRSSRAKKQKSKVLMQKKSVYTGAVPQGILFTVGWYLPKTRDNAG